MASQNSEFQGACLDSIAPVKKLLTDIAVCLELKEKKFQVFIAATPSEVSDHWTALLPIDTHFSLAHSSKCSAKDLISQLSKFMTHCCWEWHYFFDVLKCGASECQVCNHPRLPESVFKSLRHLPDPKPGVDDHYKPFAEVFEAETSEEHRPSLKKIKARQGSSVLSECPACPQYSNDAAV